MKTCDVVWCHKVTGLKAGLLTLDLCSPSDGEATSGCQGLTAAQDRRRRSDGVHSLTTKHILHSSHKREMSSTTLQDQNSSNVVADVFGNLWKIKNRDFIQESACHPVWYPVCPTDSTPHYCLKNSVCPRHLCNFPQCMLGRSQHFITASIWSWTVGGYVFSVMMSRLVWFCNTGMLCGLCRRCLVRMDGPSLPLCLSLCI